jgi:Flp pilus assembly protein TadD
MAAVIQIYTGAGNALGAPFGRIAIMRLRSLASIAISCLCVLALAGVAGAQSTQGRISGIVNDENSRPIKAATVEAENPDTNQSFTATTDEKGRFTFIGLRPGSWQFVAAAPGFFAERGGMPIRVGTPNPPIVFVLKRSGAPNGGVLGNMQAKDLQNELQAADQLFNQRKYDEAIAAYRAIMEKAPTLSAINLQIGNAFVNKKDYDSALSAYNDLLKADPGNAKGAIGIARAELARGNTDAAESTLKKAAGNPAGATREIFDNLGEIEFSRNNIDEAATWYKKAADADPSWGEPWYRLGLLAQKKGDAAGAAEYFRKVVTVDPVSAEAAMAKATLDQQNR